MKITYSDHECKRHQENATMLILSGMCRLTGPVTIGNTDYTIIEYAPVNGTKRITCMRWSMARGIWVEVAYTDLEV